MVSGQTTSFTYDASGIRVKTIKPNGTIIDHPFPNYEVENPTGTPIIRRSYFLAGQAIATRVSGDPVTGNNGLFFFYNDHLGSTGALVKSTGSLVSGSLTRYLPFGGYRGSAPSQTLTDRDFTGQRENMELGLLYYQARYYLPGVGRFLSADTLVPDPANPQSYNRYSYVQNSPLNFIDPTGHDPAPLCQAVPSSCEGWTSSPVPSSTSSPSSTIGPVFYGLPIEASSWNNGFGANWFAESYANPQSDDYNKEIPPQYTKSSGIHPGVDHAAPAGTTVYSNVYGEVQGNLYPGDEWPNVVIKIDGYDNVQTVYSNTISSVAPGTHVSPGDPIGTLEDKGGNSHLHHSLRIGDRTYNPLDYYVDPSDYSGLNWTGYADGENLHSMSSFEYSEEHNWWLEGDNAVGVTRPQ